MEHLDDRRICAHRLRASLPVAGSLVASAACAGGRERAPTGTLEPDQFLFERGNEALDERRWLIAREYFRELIDTLSAEPIRADAKLGIGDTYLGEGSAEAFVLALNEFREFLSFYPTHARADYAQYKLGMAHFHQMHSAERDQTETRDAIQGARRAFVERYPNSALIEEGQAQAARGARPPEPVRVQRRLPLLPSALVPRRRSIASRRCSRPIRSSRGATRSYFYLGESLRRRPSSRPRRCPTSIG